MPNYFTAAEALRKLKLFFSLEFDLVRHTIGFVPRIPGYIEKCYFVRHVYEDLKRARALRERVQDFGVFSPEKQVDGDWTNLVRHLMSARNDSHFFGALYRVIKVEQAESYRKYIQSTLRLNDAPSVEAIEDHLPALERQIAWGKQVLEAGSLSWQEEKEVEQFEKKIREHIQALGSLYAGAPASTSAQIPVYPEYVLPKEMELEPRFTHRSAERIYDSNYDENHPSHHSYTHFTELPIIDLVAAIVYDGRHLPFEFVADFTRQCWDEVRHSQMGFSRLTSMGIDPYQVPIPVGHYQAYVSCPLLERIAALTQVGEACSFSPKRMWIQSAVNAGDVLTALEHDFDIIDEKNHVKFGTKWMKEIMKVNKENRDFKQIVQDAEWAVRVVVNELKKEKGERWTADLGPKFESCQDSDSPLNLAPNIIIS